MSQTKRKSDTQSEQAAKTQRTVEINAIDLRRYGDMLREEAITIENSVASIRQLLSSTSTPTQKYSFSKPENAQKFAQVNSQYVTETVNLFLSELESSVGPIKRGSDQFIKVSEEDSDSSQGKNYIIFISY